MVRHTRDQPKGFPVFPGFPYSNLLGVIDIRRNYPFVILFGKILMGGLGSGRTGGIPTIERTDCLVLNVNRVITPVMAVLRRQGHTRIVEGDRAEADWRPINWYRDGEVWAQVEVKLSLGAGKGTAELRYDVDHFSRRTGPQHQTVQLETLECHYGGWRWFWICPTTGRRTTTLLLPNGAIQFRSRGPGGYKLAYQSERNGIDDKAHARLAKLFRKLKAEYDGMDSWAPRPRGMHRKTYERIQQQIEAQEAILDQGMAHLFDRLQKKYPLPKGN